MTQDTERNREIKRRRKMGETLQAIGDRFGLTKERVRQIAGVRLAKRPGVGARVLEVAQEWVGEVLSPSDLATLAGTSLTSVYAAISPPSREPIRRRIAPHVAGSLRAHGLSRREMSQPDPHEFFGKNYRLDRSTWPWPKSVAGTRCPPGLIDFLRQLHGCNPSPEAERRQARRLEGERSRTQ